MRKVLFLFAIGITLHSCTSVNIKGLVSPVGETVSIELNTEGLIRAELLGWYGNDTLIVSDVMGQLYAVPEHQILKIIGPVRNSKRGSSRMRAGVGTLILTGVTFESARKNDLHNPSSITTSVLLFGVGLLGVGSGIHDLRPMLVKPPLRAKKGFDLMLRYPQPLAEEQWLLLLQAKGQTSFLPVEKTLQ